MFIKRNSDMVTYISPTFNPMPRIQWFFPYCSLGLEVEGAFHLSYSLLSDHKEQLMRVENQEKYKTKLLETFARILLFTGICQNSHANAISPSAIITPLDQKKKSAMNSYRYEKDHNCSLVLSHFQLEKKYAQ